MVCRNIKPSIFAIDQENILFWGFVVPAHLARTLEVGFARLQSGQRTILGIALEKGSLKTSGTSVPRLQSAYDRLNVSLSGEPGPRPGDRVLAQQNRAKGKNQEAANCELDLCPHEA